MDSVVSKLAASLWTDAADQASRWNREFESKTPFFVPTPNEWLLKAVNGVPSGTALEIGVGQGRNALWLASHGWSVTGLDISDAALDLLRYRAAENCMQIETVLANAVAFDYGDSRWDLILAIYVQGLVPRLAERLVRALRPGGLLVVEGFHQDVDAVAGRPIGIGTNELLRAFASLRILHYEDTVAPADWARGELNPLVRIVARRE